MRFTCFGAVGFALALPSVGFGQEQPASAPALNMQTAKLAPKQLAIGDALGAAYPHGALMKKLPGEATVVCTVVKRHPHNCHIESEAPLDAGFGKRAATFLERMVLEPQANDGSPVEGRTFRQTLLFRVVDVGERCPMAVARSSGDQPMIICRWTARAAAKQFP